MKSTAQKCKENTDSQEIQVSSELWTPQIIGFACNWCTYAGADLAGTSRMEYPANIRIIRLMCTGRLDPTFIFKAFLGGVDGILTQTRAGGMG